MPAILIVGALVVAGGIVALALRKRAQTTTRGVAMPAGMGDPLVSVARVPIWVGGGNALDGRARPAPPGARRVNVLYSEIARHFSAIRVEGENVIVGKVSRGVPFEGKPIIRQEYNAGGTTREVWEVATAGGGAAGAALDAVIIVGGAAATAFGGPAAGLAVGAAGAAIRSQVS